MGTGGSMLPPDIREQMSQSGGRGGVGGRASENEAAASARAQAMGDPPRKDEAESERRQATDAQSSKEAPHSRCPGCEGDVHDEHDYCPKCGRDLLRKSAAEQLGIEFTEEDIEAYLFRGYVVREVKLFRGHTMTVKSSQPSDLSEIDDFIMNGSWSKTEDGRERKISDFYLRQMNMMAITAACAQKIDGYDIGGTVEERVNYFLDKGSALVDMASKCVTLFNQAITDFLSKEDLAEGS